MLELLVVIAIIGVLVAITTGTVMQVMLGQQKGNTEKMIGGTIFPNLDSQVRAVLDQAKEIPIPSNVLNGMANGDPRLAKVIWTKLQLKRNFPMTYAEAVAPWQYTGNNLLPAAIQLAPTDLPPLEVFTKNLQGVPVASFGTNPQAEMAALLRLTLTVPRRGIKPFIAENDLGPQAVADTNGDGVPEIVDVWGNPLAFFRFPTDNDDMNAAKPGSPTTDIRRDPQDPEGLLLNPTWNSQVNYSANGGNYLFEQHLHRIHDPAAPNWAPVARFMLPTIVSNGYNGRPGLIFGPTPAAVPQFYVAPGLFNFAMCVDPTDVGGYNDDIISFNLR
jgi:hypothetical protein